MAKLNLKTMKKSTKDHIITFAMVIVVYMVISRLETADGNDDTNEESIPASHSEAATVLIPLLERDEATMQKAQAQINRWETEDATDEKPRVE